MKDFAKILEEALMVRDEVLKKQKELAEEIIEEALNRFSNVDVREVIIILDEQRKQIVLSSESREGVIGREYSNLCHANVIYSIIKDILVSEYEQIYFLKDKLSIQIHDDTEDISFKLK